MIDATMLLDIPLLAAIPEHERATIASRAADIRLEPGEWLVHEGETPSFFALLAGKLALSKRAGETDVPINSYLPGAYFGEVPLLMNTSAIASVRALEQSRVLRLEGSDFRELIVNCSEMREQIVRTMTARVADLQRFVVDTPVPTVTIVGRRYDVDCHNTREFLARNHVPFTWLDPDDPAAAEHIPGDVAAEAFPVVIFPDGTHAACPSYREIAERLGLTTVPDPDRVYDVVIVGAGPAGLAAGVYGASEGLRTLLIERNAPGGQAGSSSRIENYLGFPSGLSGDDLSTRAWEQAKRFGAEMLSAREVAGLEPGRDGGVHHVVLDEGGERIPARAVVLAMGVAWRRLEAQGILELTGRGVYYGAGRTEAREARGNDVYLIGGGNSAGQAAMFFSGYARSVTLIVRGPSLAKSMSQYLIDELATKANISVKTDSEVIAVNGQTHLESIVVRNTHTNERETLETPALFVLIGADAQTEEVPPEIVRDAAGYVCTGRDILDLERPGARLWPLERDPYLLETSVPGIFAAGDVRHGSIKRVAAGVGEGSMSIALVHQYLDDASGTPAAPASMPASAAPVHVGPGPAPATTNAGPGPAPTIPATTPAALAEAPASRAEPPDDVRRIGAPRIAAT
jgi:thioredoxin reductase (NADPH)